MERKGPCSYVCTDGSRHACGVGACTCIVPTLGDPRDTSSTGIDRIPLARPPLPMAPDEPRIEKKSFSAPSTCPIDFFGPLANRAILKRLHVAFWSGLLVSYKPLAQFWGRKLNLHRHRCLTHVALALRYRSFTRRRRVSNHLCTPPTLQHRAITSLILQGTERAAKIALHH